MSLPRIAVTGDDAVGGFAAALAGQSARVGHRRHDPRRRAHAGASRLVQRAQHRALSRRHRAAANARARAGRRADRAGRHAQERHESADPRRCARCSAVAAVGAQGLVERAGKCRAARLRVGVRRSLRRRDHTASGGAGQRVRHRLRHDVQTRDAAGRRHLGRRPRRAGIAPRRHRPDASRAPRGRAARGRARDRAGRRRSGRRHGRRGRPSLVLLRARRVRRSRGRQPRVQHDRHIGRPRHGAVRPVLLWQRRARGAGARFHRDIRSRCRRRRRGGDRASAGRPRRQRDAAPRCCGATRSSTWEVPAPSRSAASRQPISSFASATARSCCRASAWASGSFRDRRRRTPSWPGRTCPSTASSACCRPRTKAACGRRGARFRASCRSLPGYATATSAWRCRGGNSMPKRRKRSRRRAAMDASPSPTFSRTARWRGACGCSRATISSTWTSARAWTVRSSSRNAGATRRSRSTNCRRKTPTSRPTRAEDGSRTRSRSRCFAAIRPSCCARVRPRRTKPQPRCRPEANGSMRASSAAIRRWTA